MSMVKQTIFKVSEKALKDGSKAFILTDNEGYICGVYATVADAEKAIPAIERNLSNGYVNRRLIEEMAAKAAKERKKIKQVSNRK